MSMNSFNGIGRLTADPEITQAANTLVAKYTLAIDRYVKQGEHPEADFLRCVCFGKTAEFVRGHLFKGMKVGVSGRVQTGSYTDKDGKKVYTTDIIVSDHTFCEKKSQDANIAPASAPTAAPAYDASQFDEAISDGDLPF